MKFKSFSSTVMGILLSACCLFNVANAGLIYSDTNILGADNIEVNGTFYQVEFIDGTCDVVFGNCDSKTQITLFDVAFYNVAFTQFKTMFDTDVNPLRDILPLSGTTSKPYNYAWTPIFHVSGTTYNAISIGIDLNGTSVRSPSNVGWSNSDTTVYTSEVFARWSVMEAAQVPEPSTIAMFALSILGLASSRFKKKS